MKLSQFVARSQWFDVAWTEGGEKAEGWGEGLSKSLAFTRLRPDSRTSAHYLRASISDIVAR